MTKPIMLVAEAWGKNEARIGKALVGASGIELLRMLDEASIITLTPDDTRYINEFWNTSNPEFIDCVWNLHPEVIRTNVFQQHPNADDLKHFCGPKSEAIPGYPKLGSIGYVRREFLYELDRLGDEVLVHDPNIIVCLGNASLWAFTGRTGVSRLRGTTCISTHCVYDYKLLPTYHPAAVLRQWELRPTTVLDLEKASRENAFPEIRRPAREIWIEPSLSEIADFIRLYVCPGSLLSVDIETAGNQVTCIGFATSISRAIVIPIVDPRKKSRSYWPTQSDEEACWTLVRGVLQDPTIPKLFQNGMYDIAFLWRSVHIAVRNAQHDTMLLHHSLWPESLKSLAYLGSLYCNLGAWKSERKGLTTIKRDA